MTAPPASNASGLSVKTRAWHLAGRLGWGVADQAMSSLTNLIVGVYVARSLGPLEFGAFSLAFATYLLAINASRGLATDPLVIRYSGAETSSWRTAAPKAAGTALVVGTVAGSGCIIGGVLLRGPTGAALTALGIMLPGLLLQDSWRFVFFSAGRGGHAFANDLLWGAALVATLFAVEGWGGSTVFWFMIAWGGSASIAAVAGMFQARLIPKPMSARGWIGQHRDLAARYVVENLTHSGGTQMRFYGLAVIAGLAAVGSLRAAELLLGPVNVLIQGIGMMAVPEVARVVRRSVRRLVPLCLFLGSLGAGGAIAWGAVLLLVPDGVGVQILGASWQSASQLLLPTTLSVCAFGLTVGAWSGLRALAAARRSLRAQALGSFMTVGGALAGAAIAGALGAAWCIAAGTWIATGVWWWQLVQETRRRSKQH